MVEYQALFEPAEEGGFVVTFPDFAGCGVTQGETEAEATEMAQDLLACMIADKIDEGVDLPVQRVHRGRKFRCIRLPALQSTKAELYRAFLATGIRKSELARRLGMSKGNIERLFNLRHQSRLDQMESAFAAVGKKLTVLIAAA
jgi:antitoxin HicB